MSKIRRFSAVSAVIAVLAALAGPSTAATSATLPSKIPSTPVVANEDVGMNPWWFDALNIADAHQQTRGEGVTVAVIDSALNLDAADLQGADISLESSATPGEPARSYPDARWAAHATAVTTVLAGQGGGTNGPGIVGVAPGAKILFYQRDPDPYTEESQTSSTYIDEAIAAGADIINISYSGTGLEHGSAIERAHDAGVVVVASAGSDDGGLDQPGNIRGVVAVGALDRDANAWSEQPGQREGALTVSAPGVDMPTGWMVGPDRGARWQSGRDTTGTSFSAPIVSGMLALVKSKYPEATGNQLIQHLIHFVFGAEDDSTWGWRRDIGFGSASVTNMLAHDPTGWPDENPLMLDTVGDIEATYPFTIYGQTNDEPDSDQPSPAANETAADSDDDTGLLPIVLGGAVVLLVLAAAAVLIIRRRSTSPSNDDAPLHQET